VRGFRRNEFEQLSTSTIHLYAAILCLVVIELDPRCDHTQVPGPAVMGFQAFA
jgi:hypothetical protein